MTFQANTIYHIYNQGNNRQKIFYKEKNYIFFLRKMRTHLLPYVDVLAYCLMPNHFHWLVYTQPEACLPYVSIKKRNAFKSKSSDELKKSNIQNLHQGIAVLLRSYTRAINKQEGRTGTLFRPKTKYKDGFVDGFVTIDGKNKNLFFSPDNTYAQKCFEYIHDNPVEANLVSQAESWTYSSAMDYANIRQGTLCNQTLAKQLNLV